VSYFLYFHSGRERPGDRRDRERREREREREKEKNGEGDVQDRRPHADRNLEEKAIKVRYLEHITKENLLLEIIKCFTGSK